MSINHREILGYWAGGGVERALETRRICVSFAWEICLIRVGSALDFRWKRVANLLDLRRIEKAVRWTHAMYLLGRAAMMVIAKG